ncbi:MAG: hypothetical protein WBG71_08310 [Leeuwenhoekiella sp.]
MKKFMIALVIAITALSCDTDNPFAVSDDQVGPITRQTTMAELDALFKSDSIVRPESLAGVIDSTQAVEVYDLTGQQLLSIQPKRDSLQKIKTIQIFDPRYTTEAGINLNSTFKDIQEAYTISRIETMLSSVLIFVKEIDAYFTIDKKELPSDLRYDFEAKIEAVQIPDNAKVKYFILSW